MMGGEEKPKRAFATRHTELDAYKKAFAVGVAVFKASKRFPKEERYSLTDQVRRSARSVAANIAEAWKKRRYEASFVSKLTDADAECAETQVWLQFAVDHGYLDRDEAKALYKSCDEVSGMLVTMMSNSSKWCRLKK